MVGQSGNAQRTRQGSHYLPRRETGAYGVSRSPWRALCMEKIISTIKRVLPKILMGVYAVFLGVMTLGGIQEVFRAWGLHGEGVEVLLMFFGGISALYVMIATWNPRKVIRGL